MKSLRLLAPYVLCAVAAVAFGPQLPGAEKEPAPKPPLIATTQGGTQWTITYSLKSPTKKPAKAEDIHNRKLRVRYSPQVLSKQVMKSPDGQVVIYTNYEAGLKSEAWVVKDYIYELPFRDGDGIRMIPKGRGDFSEIYWVSPANFHGTVEIEKRQVYLYETNSEEAPEDPAVLTPPQHDKGAQHCVAYIDTVTRLPISAKIGSETLTYEFSKGPAEFPKMDPRLSRQLKPGAE